MEYKIFTYKPGSNLAQHSFNRAYKTRNGLNRFITKLLDYPVAGIKIDKVEVWAGGDNRDYYNPDARPLKTVQKFDV